MIRQLLFLFGLAIFDLDDIARTLAASLLRAHGAEIHLLSEVDALPELRRRYLSVALETGLPTDATDAVANRAWRMVQAAKVAPQPSHESNPFYV